MRDIPEWKQWKKRLFFIKERAFLLPEHCPDLRGLRIVRSGLSLGDCLKKRFEPSQALAMALHLSGYEKSILQLPGGRYSCGKVSSWRDGGYG